MLGRRCSRALVPRPAARRASARSTPKPDNTTSTPTPPAPATEATAEPAPPPSDPGPRHACTTPDPAPGALARRLEDATEDALLAGGRAGRRAVLEDAGFGAELKARMLRRLADAPPWPGGRGEEAAVLRGMPAAKAPRGGGRVGPGWKVAGARDRAAAYPALRRREVAGLSEEERQAMKREWRERFTAGARAVPNSITGLAALANERIEDAIARGQFKNIARGQGVERDPRADNPFIDTTEYIMNKMIKRQAIVPPWIEKQQELSKAAAVFRTRLRQDWSRHAARMVAAQGGSLEEQLRRADEYARAEAVHNPKRRRSEHMSGSATATDDDDDDDDAVTVAVRPFRDAAWEAAERAFLNLSVAKLNALARSYNLMAPALAKKPYFSLARELESCFADVAPGLAESIRTRAARPARSPLDPAEGRRAPGLWARLGGRGCTTVTRLHESQAPHYGLREMWRDFWRKRAR
ncbi:hypothetical protein P8C59_008414 [Phyllachora maydis]|uniref:DnaJ homologue subfamily C member 28 conserved domain-containing protein n=1 Tax=Phyllachora maydis TaxID=1825666 RepID=A0AAD9MGT9_9PEZI|nr:hypothetical protein P8C59_008414 [Phyllachora maydis]